MRLARDMLGQLTFLDEERLLCICRAGLARGLEGGCSTDSVSTGRQGEGRTIQSGGRDESLPLPRVCADLEVASQIGRL